MNNIAIPTGPAAHRIEFFRLPAPGKRDPFFGLSRGWYYKATAAGEIKMVALRQRGALRGVRLVAYDSVCDYIQRAAKAQSGKGNAAASTSKTTLDGARGEDAQGSLPFTS